MSRNIISYNYYILTRLKQSIRQFYCYGGNQCAGHSKWANIKHIKALKDGQKSQIFTKLARQIRIAIQDGGSPNPAINSALQSAIDEAIKKNMPQSTIRGIIKKRNGNSSKLTKYILELKIRKIFIIAIAYTDNLTQLKMSISTLLRKYGGIFSAVRHTFTEKGVIAGSYNEMIKTNSFDELCAEFAINCDAEEYEIPEVGNNMCIFICSANDLDRIKNYLLREKWSIDNTEHIFIPNISVAVSEEELKNFNSFLIKLNEIDGIEDSYYNLEV